MLAAMRRNPLRPEVADSEAARKRNCFRHGVAESEAGMAVTKKKPHRPGVAESEAVMAVTKKKPHRPGVADSEDVAATKSLAQAGMPTLMMETTIDRSDTRNAENRRSPIGGITTTTANPAENWNAPRTIVNSSL